MSDYVDAIYGASTTRTRRRWYLSVRDFRQTDLRSVDFRNTRMEGASINAAKISGAYFPADLTASEIELSLLHGSRMRYRSKS